MLARKVVGRKYSLPLVDSFLLRYFKDINHCIFSYFGHVNNYL